MEEVKKNSQLRSKILVTFEKSVMIFLIISISEEFYFMKIREDKIFLDSKGKIIKRDASASMPPEIFLSKFADIAYANCKKHKT